jgi:hypothetical protein
MAKEVTSQKLKYTCDGCGLVKEWEVMNAKPEVIKEMQEWYEVGRKVIFRDQLIALASQACGIACIPAAALKLAIPQVSDDELDSDIDLASLQLGGKKTDLVN